MAEIERMVRPGWCANFRSMGKHDTCQAGVPFTSFVGDDRHMDRCPCFIKPGQTAKDRAYCEKLRIPTDEEIAAYRAWKDEYFSKMTKVSEVVIPWRKANKGKSTQEAIECPACKGRLHLSISSYNGHVHGRCETNGCVSWME